MLNRQCAGQVSMLHPRGSGGALPGLPPRLAKRSHKPTTCLLPTPSARIPHTELIFFPNLYPSFFFSYVIKTHGNKGKIKEWRKTIAESARMKRKIGVTYQMAAGEGKGSHHFIRRHSSACSFFIGKDSSDDSQLSFHIQLLTSSDH